MEKYITVPTVKSRTKKIKHTLSTIAGLGYVIGGYARYCVDKDKKSAKPCDVDVYATTSENFTTLRQRFEELYGTPKESPVSLMFQTGHLPLNLVRPINEGVIVAVGDPVVILDNFDYTITKCCLLDENSALAHYKFFEHNKARLLVIEKIHCPVSAVYRIIKYTKKGYWVRPIEVLKLFADWDGRGPEYRGKLIDFIKSAEEFYQSGGVDKLSEQEIQEMERMLFVD